MQILQVKTQTDFNESQVPAGKLLVWLEVSEGKATFHCKDENGNVSQIGGSQYNKGYFATEAALNSAYPTGEAGWYAIVGATDTVWIWDTDTEAWVDSGASSSELPVTTLGTSGTITIDRSVSDRFILTDPDNVILALSGFDINKEAILVIENGYGQVSFPASNLKWDNTNSESPPILMPFGYDLIKITKVATDKYLAEHIGGYSLMPATSYNNTGGTGSRTSLITITYGGGWYRADPITRLIDGAGSWTAINTQDVSGDAIAFDFGEAVYINEISFYCQSNYDNGTWQWVGSNDGSTWSEALCSATTLQSTPTAPVVFNLATNATSYRYYKMIGVSGTTKDADYFVEVEFKIDDTLNS